MVNEVTIENGNVDLELRVKEKIVEKGVNRLINLYFLQTIYQNSLLLPDYKV